MLATQLLPGLDGLLTFVLADEFVESRRTRVERLTLFAFTYQRHVLGARAIELRSQRHVLAVGFAHRRIEPEFQSTEDEHHEQRIRRRAVHRETSLVTRLPFGNALHVRGERARGVHRLDRETA